MSFLAGRLAGKEGAFFLQESKDAVGRLVQKSKTKKLPSSSQPPTQTTTTEPPSADVLPEILRHSLPPKILQPPSESSLSTASKWVLQSDPSNHSSVSRDALNPLRAYVSMPQVTFGPKRWQMPTVDGSVSASTANELRRDKYTPMNPEKLKAAAAGLSQIAKAFAVATALVFGGGTLMFGLAASKLELHNSDDIKNKGKDLVQPKLEMFKEQMAPVKIWAERTSKKWHIERDQNIQEKTPLMKEFSKTLGAKTPD